MPLLWRPAPELLLAGCRGPSGRDGVLDKTRQVDLRSHNPTSTNTTTTTSLHRTFCDSSSARRGFPLPISRRQVHADCSNPGIPRKPFNLSTNRNAHPGLDLCSLHADALLITPPRVSETRPCSQPCTKNADLPTSCVPASKKAL